jgi:hypothetical protein
MSIRKQKHFVFCKLISNGNFDRTTSDQLRRASFSIMLNIAEGSSRFSNKDRKNFMVVARGSAFDLRFSGRERATHSFFVFSTGFNYIYPVKFD